MNAIKRWVDELLKIPPEGKRPVSLTEMRDTAVQSVSRIQELLIYAKTQSDGLIPVREGLKTLKITPLIFIANLAKSASEISDSETTSDPFSASCYGFIANSALCILNEELTAIQANYGVNAGRDISGVNAYLNNPDLSLNFIHLIQQITSLVSLPPNGPAITDIERSEEYFKGQATNATTYSQSIATTVAGVNSYFVQSLIAHPLLDYEQYAANIGKFDLNSPYIYRIKAHDFAGASLTLFRISEHLGYDQRVLLAMEYLKEVTVKRPAFLDLNDTYVSKSVDVKRLDNYMQELRIGKDSLTPDQLVRVYGHVFSYSTALGIAPTAALELNEATIDTFSTDAIRAAVVQHIELASVYAGKLRHSQATLDEAQEKVSAFMSSSRL